MDKKKRQEKSVGLKRIGEISRAKNTGEISRAKKYRRNQ